MSGRSRTRGGGRDLCRGCDTPVRWVTLIRSGKRIPVETGQAPEDGTVLLHRVHPLTGAQLPQPMGEIISSKGTRRDEIEADGDLGNLRVNHHGTCPARRRAGAGSGRRPDRLTPAGGDPS